MSNLSNLHISGSYRGLINLEDSTKSLPSQSGDIQLQDGLGNNVGLKINAQTNKFTVVNDLQVDGNADFNGSVDISGSITHTGSLDVLGDITASGNIRATIGNFDTINTRLLHVTEESASVILSSGSNVIGDDITDTQTIVGITTISGSLGVTGTQSNTGSLTVSGDISSSTLNGVGNVTEYSSSVDSRINSLSNRTGSVDSSIVALNAFTSSQLSINSGYNTFTSSYYVDSASFDSRVTALEDFSSSLVADFVTDTELSSALESVTSSLQAEIDTKLDSSWTSSVFTPFSSSVDSRIDSKLDISTFTSFSSSVDSRILTNAGDITSLSASIAVTDLNQQNQIDSLISATGSYARLDIDNNFSGSQIITGSVNGNVESLTVTSQTASIDCSQGNFFTLELPSGATHFEATNIVPGQTISLRLGANSGRTVTFDSSIELPVGLTYSPSVSSSYDLLTFVSFDTTTLYGVAVNLFNR